MIRLAAELRAFPPERWLGMSGGRARCVRHFIGIAATLGAAKVFLATVGLALFIANEGPERLPLFYVLLAVLMVALSLALVGVFDRVARIRLAQSVFAAVLVFAAAVWLLILLDVPGAFFLALAGAHILEIAIDILFWAVFTAYVDAVEFKRAAPFIYLALALGGALGGGLARGLSPVLPIADLLLVLVPLGLLALAQLSLAARRLDELRDGESTTPGLGEPDRPGFAVLLRAVSQYPLLLLIALNALLLTILYGLSEYLIFTIYHASFASEQQLAAFLALVFAGMQMIEFTLLATVSRALLQQAQPLPRNLIFPITSLVCLSFLATSSRLSAAVIAHINVEALSNAIFQPVNNANYLPLPIRLQGHARALVDGIFYPTGLALAGVVLAAADRPSELEVEFMAFVVGMLFLLQNVGVGVLFLPTLLRSARSGTPHLRLVGASKGRLAASAAHRVRTLLRNREPELRHLGLALSRHLDASLVAEDLLALGDLQDRPTRRALAGAFDAMPPADVMPRLEACLAGGDENARLVALQLLLKGRQPVATGSLQLAAASNNPAVDAVARLVSWRPDQPSACDSLAALIRIPEVAGEVIEAITFAERTELATVVAACLERAPPEQRRRGLDFLARAGGGPGLDAPAVARRWWRDDDPRSRAAAVALLASAATSAEVLAELAGFVRERNPMVRRRAAESLARHGDGAIPHLRRQLVPIATGSAEAAWALAQIRSPAAERALDLYARALLLWARHARRLLAGIGEARGWEPLQACVHDLNARIFHVAMTIIAKALDEADAGHLRDALRSSDPRRRANAFEALSSLPQQGCIPVLTRAVGAICLDHGDARANAISLHAATGVTLPAQALDDPWLRAAAALHGLSPRGDGTMAPSVQDLERVLVLKRLALFRYLPLDTLLALARVLESEALLAGEVIRPQGGRIDHLYILEAGKVRVITGESGTTLGAPACLGEIVLVGEVVRCDRIETLEASRLLRLHHLVFNDLARDYPEIVMELCKLLARQLRTAGHGQDPRPRGDDLRPSDPASAANSTKDSLR